MANANRAWYRELNGYHWLVLGVCTLAWAFDCLNQQIFNLSRKPALADLLDTSPSDPTVPFYGSLGNSALLIGWAVGGILFGILGDRIGRVKTLVIMILCFSLSTGLCGLSRGPWDYIFFSFLTGVGAGSVFPLGCTLVAESLPDRARPSALGMLQAFSAFGGIAAGLISLLLITLWSHGVIASQWRWLFSVGIVPSLLSLIAARKLHEPELWTAAVAREKAAGRAGSLAQLFGDARWRPRAIVGLLLAVAGVVGLWGIGVFSNDLTQSFIGAQYDDEARAQGQARQDLAFVAQIVASPEALQLARKHIEPRDLLGIDSGDGDAKWLYTAALSLHAEGQSVSPQSVLARLDRPEGDRPAQTGAERRRREEYLKASAAGLSPQEHVSRILQRQKARGIRALRWAAVTLMMFAVGAFFGVYAFAHVTERLGRRATFAIFFCVAAVTTAFCFLWMSKTLDLFWMVPLMGAAQLSIFGGYAIYFPELFPTYLRSTGTSFCYNVGRFVAAAGPLGTGLLTKYVFAGTSQPLRYAGVSMCGCFLLGLVVLLFAPETKGEPLPE